MVDASIRLLELEAFTKMERDRAVEDRALKEFYAARDALKKEGADVSDFASLGKMIANTKELNFDPERIVAEIAAVDSLLSRRAELERSVAALTKRDATEGELGQLLDQLKGKESITRKRSKGLALGSITSKP